MDDIELTIIIRVGATINPVEDLGEEKDLYDFLDNDGCEPCDAPEIVHQALVVTPGPEVGGEGVPVHVERSKNGNSCKSLQDGKECLVVLDEASEEPCDANGDVHIVMILEAVRIQANLLDFVENNPDEERTNAHEQAVSTVPVHGLTVIEIADPAAYNALGLGSVITAVVLSVTHTCLFKFLLKL